MHEEIFVVLAAVFIASMLHSSEAICKRPEELKNWKRKSLIERVAEADIVIYGKVLFSPCWKPGYTTPATTTTHAPKTSVVSQNYTLNATTAPSVENITATIVPTTVRPYNCSSAFYSATFQVHCVIKGGILPPFLLLHGFGHGDGICLEESYHDFHAYRDLNYVVLVGRDREVNGTVGFWINTVNHQPAATEITDEELLDPIFKAVGRNARGPIVASNKTLTKELCKPPENSASFHDSSSLISILTVLFLLNFLRIF